MASFAFAACSHGPTSPSSLGPLAAHFDSLATVERDKSGSNLPRLQILEMIAQALARGASPGVVTMTIAGTPVTVHMVAVEATYSAADASGNVYAGGWVDADADSTFFVSTMVITDGFIDQLVAFSVGDSIESTQTYPPQFAYSQRSTGAVCANYPIENPFFAATQPCHLAVATLSFDVVPAGSLLPAGAAIVSPPITFGVAQLVPTQ